MVLLAMSHTLPPAVRSSESMRINRYTEAREFYEGTQWLGRARRGETRMVLNYARRVLQAAVAYMFAAPVRFNVPSSEETQEGSTAAALAERTLADYLGHIGADELDVELALDAAVSGDALIKITWDPAARFPVVTPVDPAQARVETRPDRPKVAVAWEHWYDMTADELAAAIPEHAAAVYAIPTVERDASGRLRVVERWTAERWTLSFGGVAVVDDANPYGWLPYVPVVNNPTAREFWGSSDLRDLYDVCRQLNARMSVVADVLDLSGAPIAVLENVEGSEGIRVGPGAKWELPEASKAYLLDLLQGGGVQLHIDYIEQAKKALHDLSETPRTAFGDTGRVISGSALEVEVQPLVQKVRRKRRGFDRFYRERNGRLLDLAERFGGVGLGGVRRAVSVWPDILPSDAQAEAVRLAQLTGADDLAHRTAMAELGIEDPEREWARLLEERGALAQFDIAVAAAQAVARGFGGEGGEGGEDERDGGAAARAAGGESG